MATESFYEDMVIDTPEAAANLTALFESGVKWKRGDSNIDYVDADDESVADSWRSSAGNDLVDDIHQ